MLRAGFPGGLTAWAGFTLPSALALILFAYGLGRIGDISHLAWLHGLKIVAVAVVALVLARSAAPASSPGMSPGSGRSRIC